MAVFGPRYLSLKKMPVHIAMIMDGNGRWARSQGMKRVFGHEKGVSTVRKMIRYSNTLGLQYLTLYAFSGENWKRPKEEVNFIFSLIGQNITHELPELKAQNIKVEYIGDLSRLAPKVRDQLAYAHEELCMNTGMTLVIAVSYGSRDEIVKACQKAMKEAKTENLDPKDLNEEVFQKFLQTSSYPDPDLLIRTSGELRISNFLLWQLAYSELYFSSKMWPEFESYDYLEAVSQFQNRKRRYGTIIDH